MTVTHNYFQATPGYLAIGNQLNLKALQAAHQDADRRLRSNALAPQLERELGEGNVASLAAVPAPLL